MSDLPAEAEIRAMLERQAACWNCGELERYLSFYADDALYVSAEGALLCGRDAIGQSLIPRYGVFGQLPGSLSYGNLFVRVLSPDYCLAYGRYRIEMKEEGAVEKGGFFSLVLRYGKGVWQILLDHPS